MEIQFFGQTDTDIAGERWTRDEIHKHIRFALASVNYYKHPRIRILHGSSVDFCV